MDGEVRYEQAVYGSFPFWDKGYALLGHSPGCLPTWLEAFAKACQRFGERPRGASGALRGVLFTVRRPADRRLWLVVGVFTAGADDHGRPDALAFHGLFVPEREFARVGYDPFALAGCLRGDWGPASTRLDAGACRVGPPAVVPDEGTEAARVAAALRRGKRVAIESAAPIEALARSAWAALPVRARSSRTVATLAFANGLRFDLLAALKLAALELDASYVDPSAEPVATWRTRPVPPRLLLAGALAVGLAALAALGYGLWRRGDGGRAPTFGRPSGGAVPLFEPAARSAPSPRGPARVADPVAPEDPDEARAVERGLAAIGGRFLGLEEDAARGATAWMLALAALRYEGPVLTGQERAAIARDATPGWSRALAWDVHVRRFRPDRPLPEGFASGPLRWQLDTLAWSFHLELDPKLTAAEVPAAIADALAMDEPARPNPLEAKYPALSQYARFLGRLPVR